MDDKRSSSAVWIAALGLVLLLLTALYVLSIGPVAMMYPDEAPPWAEAFYAPILWLCDEFDFAQDLLELYLGLWGVGP